MEPLRRCPECGFELLPDESMCRMCHVEIVDREEARPRRRRDASVLKIIGVLAILILATFGASMAFDGIYREPPESKIVLSQGSWNNLTDIIPPPRKEYVIVQVTVTNEFDEKVTLFIDMFRLETGTGVSYGAIPGIVENFQGDIPSGASVAIAIGFSIGYGEVPTRLIFDGLGQRMELALSNSVASL